MIIYVAERCDWDGVQDYALFATRELAEQYISRQDKRFLDQWNVIEAEVEFPG